MNAIVAPLNTHKTLIVIGNGMVGHHCVEQLVARGALEQYRLHVFSEEPMRAYDRVHLSEYFSGRDAESLALGDAALYQAPGLTLHLGVAVLRIDREHRQVITAAGPVHYDKLVLATGSYPFVPPIEAPQAIRAWSIAPCKTSTPSAPRPPMPGAAWWWAAGCSAWRRPTP